MKCGHCLTVVDIRWAIANLQHDMDSQAKGMVWRVRHGVCPACQKIIVELGLGSSAGTSHYQTTIATAYPRGLAREPLSPEVPAEFATDYTEAVAVLTASPKASAALSRRCLQHIIRERAGITRRDLATEISDLIDSRVLPSYLSEAIDGVRNVGNFAAHPIKSTATGEIVDVEPGEAEWLLDTLEGLFDFYFVQPALLQRKRDALNAKLQAAGKPPMK